ncbi:MAG: hypothetical protein NPIRA01_00680 [Nitrospirales bacterium]|nr:MAG: hypothetical protein NPIRA01_00680 [Nitrospirales bacterium]
MTPLSIKETRDYPRHIKKKTEEISAITQQLNRLMLGLRTPDHLSEEQVRITTKIEDELTILLSQTKHVKREMEAMVKEIAPQSIMAGPLPDSVGKANPRKQVGEGEFKINAMSREKTPRWRQYAKWVIGTTRWPEIFKYELITSLLGNVPGAIGYYLRSKVYRWILGDVGSNTVLGRSVILRHPHKIRIGKNVTIDDNCVLDAKGQSNKGIQIGDNVYIGRNSIVYCKDGNIDIQSKANIGSNCEIFSGDHVFVGNGSMIAAYCYIMSGNSYDYESQVAFSDQKVYSKGSTTIGQNCWLGAKVVVLDGVSIGDSAVVGAGAVVTNNLPSRTISMGLPAKSVSSCNSEIHK